MAKLTKEQIIAVETVLKQYFPDANISLMGMFLEALDAFEKGAPEKRSRLDKGAVRIPDDIPTEEQKQKATGSWQRVGRGDLVLRIGEIVEEFRSYHLARGSRMESWGHAWATWYRRQPEFQKPTGQPTLAFAAFEDCSTAAWVRRLEIFAGKTEEPRGAWRQSWGPPPKSEGCKVPESAKKEYLSLYPPKAAKGT